MKGRRAVVRPTSRVSGVGRETGSTAVELVFVLPVLLMAVAVVVVGARVALAGERISGVAGSASRAASLSRSAAAADAAARADAVGALAAADLHCDSTLISVDTTGFGVPAGTPASVRVTVSCTVSLSSIGIAGLPGTRTLTDTAVSPLDPLRDLG